jgi:hypothetical protein
LVQQLTANNITQKGTALRLFHQGWNSHVDGAVALVKARGPEEFQSPKGREIWHLVRALAVSHPSFIKVNTDFPRPYNILPTLKKLFHQLIGGWLSQPVIKS